MQTLKTSDLIRQALPYLSDGKDYDEVDQGKTEEYLCHAISRAARGGHKNWMFIEHRAELRIEQRIKEVRGMIEKRLSPYNSLESWLKYVGNVCGRDLTRENLQKHRKQWARRMIAEFKRKGD